MADATFASLGRPQRGVRSACPICGQATAGTVQMLLQSRSSGRKPKSVVSVSKRLCERHAVALYQALDVTWEQFFSQGAD